MKKILVIAIAALVSYAASAQFYVGGSLNANINDNSYFSIVPEAGYVISDELAVGASIDFTSSKAAYSCIEFAPYVRWTFADFAPVQLFLDGGITVSSMNDKVFDDTYNAFQIGVKPGFAMPLNDKLSLVGHLGFLGYTANENNANWLMRSEGLGISFSGYDVTFGVFYNF